MNEEGVLQNYKEMIDNRIEKLGGNDETDVNKRWENVEKSIKETADETIGRKKSKNRKVWVTEDLLKMMEVRLSLIHI